MIDILIPLTGATFANPTGKNTVLELFGFYSLL